MSIPVRLLVWTASIWILRPACVLAEVRPIQPAESAVQEELAERLEATSPPETLTQEEAVRTALDHHPMIRRAEARVEQAQARLTEARRWFRPKISVYAGERLDADRHRVGIQISHDLDDLWSRSKVHEAESELTVAEQDLALTRQEVVEEAVAAYNAWASVRGEMRRFQRRVERARKALAHGHEQYEEGLISRARLTELEQSLETTEQSHEEASLRLAQAAVRLRQAMGELGT